MNEDMFNSEEETLHTLHQWIPLSSGVFLNEYHSQLAFANIATKKDARGYVHFPNPESYDLSDPYTVSLNHTHYGPGYMLSAFHQLHCLNSLRNAINGRTEQFPRRPGKHEAIAP